MAGNGSKWLAGCSIGCGALLLLAVVLGTSGYLFIKSRMQGFEEAEREEIALQRKFGRIEDFCPDPHGGLPADRIRLFLDVREKLAPARREFETSLSSLADGIHQAKEGQDSFPQIVDLIGKGFGLIPQLGHFQTARLRGMQGAGMGPGEYLYYYVLAYYSWLGKSPGDGPPFRIQGRQGRMNDDSMDSGDVREERAESITRHVRRSFLAMLRNQRTKLQQGRAEAEQDPWQKALDAEISALEKDRSRLPWQDGLPRKMQDSLAPFRVKLLESYNPVLNPFELELWNRRGTEDPRGQYLQPSRFQ